MYASWNCHFKGQGWKKPANLSESLQATSLPYLSFLSWLCRKPRVEFLDHFPAITFPSSSLFVKADEFKSINFNAQDKHSPTRYLLPSALSINSRELKYSALCRSGFIAAAGPGWVPHWSLRKSLFTHACWSPQPWKIHGMPFAFEKNLSVMSKTSTEQRPENCRQFFS